MANNNKGQSTIEFVITFTTAVGFIFLFLKMSLNYTNGFMVHHASFMAARSYLVGDSERQEVTAGDEEAFKQAQAVFKKYLPDGLISNFDGELKENEPNGDRLPVFTGVYVDFTQTFSIGFIGGKEKIQYRSEAFLGREPTRSETVQQVCRAMLDLGLSNCTRHVTLDDNGG